MDEPTLVYPKGYNHRRGCSRTHPVTHPCDNGTPVRSEPGAEGLREAAARALDLIETAMNWVHPGDFTEDELAKVGQSLYVAADELRTTLAATPAADSRGLDVEDET